MIKRKKGEKKETKINKKKIPPVPSTLSVLISSKYCSDKKY